MPQAEISLGGYEPVSRIGSARFSIETRIILRAIPLLTEIVARTALGLMGEKSGPE